MPFKETDVGRRIRIRDTYGANWLDVGSTYTISGFRGEDMRGSLRPLLKESRQPDWEWATQSDGDYEFVDEPKQDLLNVKYTAEELFGKWIKIKDTHSASWVSIGEIVKVIGVTTDDDNRLIFEGKDTLRRWWYQNRNSFDIVPGPHAAEFPLTSSDSVPPAHSFPTKEEIMAKYPEGTVVKCTTGVERTVSYSNPRYPQKEGSELWGGTTSPGFRVKLYDHTHTASDPYWAPIIGKSSQPLPTKERLMELYPDGTVVKCLYNGTERTVSHGSYQPEDGKRVWVDTSNSLFRALLFDSTKSPCWAEVVKPAAALVKDPVEINLKKAKRLFPAGTMYKAVHITGELADETQIVPEGDCIEERSTGSIDIPSHNGYMYISGCWAEVVSQPSNKPETPSIEELIAEANRRYPKGTKYRPLKCNGDVRDFTETACYPASHVKGEPHETLIDVGIDYVFVNGKWADTISNATENKQTPSLVELLAEADRRYPFGTAYHSMFADGTMNHDRHFEAYHAARHVEPKSDGKIRIHVGWGYVYVDGKWAPIKSFADGKASQHIADFVRDNLVPELPNLKSAVPINTLSSITPVKSVSTQLKQRVSKHKF